MTITLQEIMAQEPMIRRLAKYMLKNCKHAITVDDMVTDALTALWKASAKYNKTEATFITFANTVAKNAMLQRLRFERRRGLRFKAGKHGMKATGENVDSLIPALSARLSGPPTNTFNEHLAGAWARKALPKLHPLQQEVIRAHFWEGRDPIEWARAKGFRTRRGRELLNRALRNLRAITERADLA